MRDGLKPVLYLLYSMDQNGNTYNKAHIKSARVVGDVIGKYHPHGDSAVYDTLLYGWRNHFLYVICWLTDKVTSVRWTVTRRKRQCVIPVRMQKITQELLTDLDKETVDFSPNYDGKEMIPDVLPT